MSFNYYLLVCLSTILYYKYGKYDDLNNHVRSGEFYRVLICVLLRVNSIASFLLEWQWENFIERGLIFNNEMSIVPMMEIYALSKSWSWRLSW